MGDMYKPSGELQGDTKPMPDRGVSTGLGDTYGADTGPMATGSMGKITGATKSESPFDNMPCSPDGAC